MTFDEHSDFPVRQSANPSDLFRLLVESATDYAIYAMDPDGYILTWNRGGERIKGYKADEIIGKHFSIFYTTADRATAFPTTELEITRREGRFENEGWRVRKDGSLFWARIVLSALHDGDGEFVGFAKVAQDLTARREAEEQARRLAVEEAARQESMRRAEELASLNDQLQENALELEAQTAEAQELMRQLERTNYALQRALKEAERARADAERAAAEAEEANRAKSDFLAVMSHELRTPLNAIAGYAELVGTGVYGPTTQTQRDALTRIQRSQRHLLSLINDVLNFAKLEAGHVDISLETVNVNEVLSRMDGMIGPLLHAKELCFVRRDAPAGLAVKADPEKLTQVLLNLLSNAIKFTPDGGSIWVGAEEVDDRVAIQVRDSGIGIEPEKLLSVFEPFVQVFRDLTSVHEGTGLGLAISHDLVQLMGGELTVESEPDVGSTFTVALPRA